VEFHDFRDATRDPLPAFILVVDSLHAGKKAHNFILVYPVLAYDMSYAKCNLSFLLTFLCRRLTQADKQLRALGHIDLTTLTSQLEKRHLSKVAMAQPVPGPFADLRARALHLHKSHKVKAVDSVLLLPAKQKSLQTSECICRPSAHDWSNVWIVIGVGTVLYAK